MPDQQSSPSEWLRTLETLFPSDVVTLHDIRGNEYTVRKVLSARQETGLLRILGKVSELPVGEWSASFKVDDQNPRAAIESMMGLVGKLVSEPRVLDLLDEAFCFVFGQVVAEALEDCKDDLNGVEHPSAVDVFDTMEMVSALVPFGVRVVTKGAKLFKAIPSQPKVLPSEN